MSPYECLFFSPSLLLLCIQEGEKGKQSRKSALCLCLSSTRSCVFFPYFCPCYQYAPTSQHVQTLLRMSNFHVIIHVTGILFMKKSLISAVWPRRHQPKKAAVKLLNHHTKHTLQTRSEECCFFVRQFCDFGQTTIARTRVGSAQYIRMRRACREHFWGVCSQINYDIMSSENTVSFVRRASSAAATYRNAPWKNPLPSLQSRAVWTVSVNAPL